MVLRAYAYMVYGNISNVANLQNLYLKKNAE